MWRKREGWGLGSADKALIRSLIHLHSLRWSWRGREGWSLEGRGLGTDPYRQLDAVLGGASPFPLKPGGSKHGSCPEELSVWRKYLGISGWDVDYKPWKHISRGPGVCPGGERVLLGSGLSSGESERPTVPVLCWGTRNREWAHSGDWSEGTEVLRSRDLDATLTGTKSSAPCDH